MLARPTDKPEEPIPPLKAAILSRVQKRMRAKGLKRATLGPASGLGPDLVRDWWRKAKAMPSIASLAAIAPTLGTSPEWLAFGVGPEEIGRDAGASWTMIPIVSWVAAGKFATTGDYQPDTPLLFQTGLPAHRFMALTVRGDSMNLVAPDGCTIIVDLDDVDLIHRRLYVFLDGSSATFKRYMTNPMRLEPDSTNPSHEAIDPGPDVRPLGRVVRIIYDP